MIDGIKWYEKWIRQPRTFVRALALAWDVYIYASDLACFHRDSQSCWFKSIYLVFGLHWDLHLFFSWEHCQYTSSNVGTWKHHSANMIQIRDCLNTAERMDDLKGGEQLEDRKKASSILSHNNAVVLMINFQITMPIPTVCAFCHTPE